MTLRVFILVLVVATGVFIVACQAGGTNRAGESSATSNANSPDSKTATVKPSLDEIRAVLSAHDKALGDKNLDALMETFSTDATTVVMGTGAEERWMGPQEIRAAYTEIVKDYDAGTMTCDCSKYRTGGSADDATMAWIAATCECKDSLAGKSREYKLNTTATMAKQNGKWRFVQLHMSNAPQGPPTK